MYPATSLLRCCAAVVRHLVIKKMRTYRRSASKCRMENRGLNCGTQRQHSDNIWQMILLQYLVIRVKASIK